MWIELSKILPYLVFPLSLFLELVFIGWLIRRFGGRKFGGFLVFAGFAVLLASSSPVVSHKLNHRLEGWYQPVTASQAPQADVIILLGGALSLPLPPRVSPELADASDRILYAARLYRAGKARRILVTGGNVFKQAEGIGVESDYIAGLLAEWGVPRSAILIENESRNTRENALKSRGILAQHGVKSALLVTSAFHMPRAAATFKAAGIEAVPLPTDFTFVEYNQPVLLDWLPSAYALAGTTRAVREHLGILVYGLRGWLKT